VLTYPSAVVREYSMMVSSAIFNSNCNSKSYQIQLLEVLHCQQVLLESLGEYILSGDLCFEMSVLMEEEFATKFGEKFTSLAVHHSEFSSYFI